MNMCHTLNMDDTGQKLYEKYVNERINGNVSLWAPMKKQNNKMFTSGNKKCSVKIRDIIGDLKETKNLCGRLMILTKSNRDINQKEAIGYHEFTLTPRSFFNPNGTLLLCTDKSKLIHLLVKLISEQTIQNLGPEIIYHKIGVVDGMVLVQKLPNKATAMVTVKDLSMILFERLMSLTQNYDEIILVFDTYKADSLKRTIREKICHVKDPV